MFLDLHDENMAWLGNPAVIFMLSCSLVCLFLLFEYLERWRAEDAEVAAATAAITAATHAIADETARKNGREPAGSARLTAETLQKALSAIDILVKNRRRGDDEKEKLDEVKQMLQEKLEDTLDTEVARERKYLKMMKHFEERGAKEGITNNAETQKRQAAFIKDYIKRTSSPAAATKGARGSSNATSASAKKKSKAQLSAGPQMANSVNVQQAPETKPVADTDPPREQNPYAAMEPGSERFKWYNGPTMFIYLYDLYRTTCYNIYEWLREHRDVARQRIREIEAEEERMLLESEGLVPPPPATDTSVVRGEGPLAAAPSPSLARDRTKIKKKNGKKKSSGAAGGSVRKVGTTTVKVSNLGGGQPSSLTSSDELSRLSPDLRGPDLQATGHSEPATAATVREGASPQATGIDDGPHGSFLAGGQRAPSQTNESAAGPGVTTSTTEPGHQKQEKDREGSSNEEAGYLTAPVPTSSEGGGLGADRAIDPAAIPNAVTGSSYGGYVGADVARKAAEELAYAVAHSESVLFTDIIDDDDLEELAKEAIFYDSMHSPDEGGNCASPNGGQKKSKKQKKRAKKREKSRSASGSVGEDDVPDNGNEAITYGTSGSGIDALGGTNTFSDTVDKELLRIREQEAEKERRASVEAMTSRLIQNAANGSTGGAAGGATGSLTDDLTWCTERSNRKSQGGASRTDELRRRVVEFYAKGVKDKTNHVASTLRDLRDLEAYFKVLSDKLSPEGLMIQRKCTIELAKLARCTDPRKREVQEDYVEALKKRSERFSADCIYIHYELNKLHRCPAWQSAVQYLQSRDAETDAMEGELSFEELANELRQEAKGRGAHGGRLK